MFENNLDCCVVRDLIPSYLEELTEAETSAMVKEHIEHGEACRQFENDMRVQVPIEKAPKRALKFLKRVKRTRLMAATLAAIVALFCMWWLYDQEFHYTNTEVGRLEAVCDYIPQPIDSTMPHGVKAGTPVRAVAWQAIDNHLFIFFGADNEENVHGVMHLVRGVNGKYRAIESSYAPSQYTAGVYGESLTPKGTDWKLFMLAGDNCRDIYSAEVHYIGLDYDGIDQYTAVKTYELSDSNFLWIIEHSELEQELGLSDKDITGLHIEDVRLLDKNGEDVTGEYKDESMTASWGAGKGTAELFLLYVYMGIVAALGVVFIRYFLRKD